MYTQIEFFFSSALTIQPRVTFNANLQFKRALLRRRQILKIMHCSCHTLLKDLNPYLQYTHVSNYWGPRACILWTWVQHRIQLGSGSKSWPCLFGFIRACSVWYRLYICQQTIYLPSSTQTMYKSMTSFFNHHYCVLDLLVIK